MSTHAHGSALCAAARDLSPARRRAAASRPASGLSGLVEEVFGAVHDNIGALYRDLFIETCDPWVIPYIGDLLGVSCISGDTWTLRADVADTIDLRR